MAGELVTKWRTNLDQQGLQNNMLGAAPGESKIIHAELYTGLHACLTVERSDENP